MIKDEYYRGFRIRFREKKFMLNRKAVTAMVYFRSGTNEIPSMEYTNRTKETAFAGMKIRINDYLKKHPEELDKRWKVLGIYKGKDYCKPHTI